MERCDALIVGGGPAGSSCARELVAGGRDVIVLDKRPFPRDKTCAGWVTPAVVGALELEVEDYRRGRVFQPITGFRTSLLSGNGRAHHEAHVRYEEPVSYGIRRCEFDDYLLRRSGARLRLGEAFKSMQRRGQRWVVTTSGGGGGDEIDTPLVIGAGGHFCPVARALGGKAAGDEAGTVVAAQEAEFELTDAEAGDCPFRGDTPELFFCRDLRGYAWVFRKGNHLNIGLGREDNQRLSEHVGQFCEFLRHRGRLTVDLSGSGRGFHGHAYILYGHAQRELVGEGVLLIGDAAGLAYPESGEGIRPAVESGLLAARAILAAGGDTGREALAAYAAGLVARLGPRRPRRGLTAVLPGRLKSALAARLLAREWFARHVVMNSWFLHATQPPLGAVVSRS